MNNDQELYTQQLAQFAVSQSFDERSVEFFDDVWQEAGVKDIAKMTTADAKSVLQVLGESELDFGQKEVGSRVILANQKTSHQKLPQFFYKLSQTELNA